MTTVDRTRPTSRARPPRVEQILHIADKPEVALKLAKAFFPKMSDSDLEKKGQTVVDCVTAYKIDKDCFTSVNGSITKFDVPAFRDWNDPVDIIGCELKGGCKLDELWTNKLLEHHIQSEAQISDRVMIWTDCDDEGEFIAHRLRRICLTAGLLDDRVITIKRVIFESLDSEEIIKAERRARDEKNDGINMKVVAAVEFQKKLDTIISLAFTEFQMSLLAGTIDLIAGTVDAKTKKDMLSFGICKIVTLQLVYDGWLSDRKKQSGKDYEATDLSPIKTVFRSSRYESETLAAEDSQTLKKSKVEMQGTFLGVYPYDHEVPKKPSMAEYKEGDEFKPSLEIKRGTLSPSLLNETGLLTAMFEAGINSPSSMHRHVDSIRSLVEKTTSGYFCPTVFACALIEGYQSQGVTWATDIRKNIKKDMEVIKNGEDGKKVLRKHLEMWKTKLSRAQEKGVNILEFIHEKLNWDVVFLREFAKGPGIIAFDIVFQNKDAIDQRAQRQFSLEGVLPVVDQ